MENLTPLLEQLATKLGTTTEYLWTILLKQAPIHAFTIIGAFIFCILFGILLLRIFSKYRDTVEYKMDWQIPFIFISIIWMFVFIIVIAYLSSAITALLNPEYYALQQILNAIKHSCL